MAVPHIVTVATGCPAFRPHGRRFGGLKPAVARTGHRQVAGHDNAWGAFGLTHTVGPEGGS